MDEDKLIFSIPAQISILPKDELSFQEKNNFVTPVKLKVFYKGTTPDGRTFTEDFSSQVIKSLPQTPVVAYYDEEDDDFIGHNDEQYVYGYVPEVGSLGFEEIDGQTWAVTDIVLFTGRDDNIGNVAKKIIGKKHSLELDKNSTKYQLKKDKYGRITEMVFTEGNIIGLSVLGDNQTPGFTGSAFFTQQEQTIQELISKYTDIKQELNISNFIELFSNEKNKDGGVEMNFSTETIAVMNNFMKETYDEKTKKVFAAAIEKFGNYVYVVQVSDTMVVFVDYEDGKYYRTDYTSSEEGITFGDKLEVKPRFLTDEEINNTFAQLAAENANDNGNSEVNLLSTLTAFAYNGQTTELGASNWFYGGDITSLPSTGHLQWNLTETTDNAPQWFWDTYTPTDAPVVTTTATVPEVQKGKFVSDEEAAQIEADRVELETYRADKKLSVIKKFAKFLTEEEVKSYTDSLGKYSVVELEKELSYTTMQKLLKEQQEENNESAQFKATKIHGANEGSTKSAIEQTNDLIKRYK